HELRLCQLRAVPCHRARKWRVLRAEQYLSGAAGTAFLRAKPAINAAPMKIWARRAAKLILVTFGILGAGVARAQNAPWCLESSEGSLRCTYATFQQCLADRPGH